MRVALQIFLKTLMNDTDGGKVQIFAAINEMKSQFFIAETFGLSNIDLIPLARISCVFKNPKGLPHAFQEKPIRCSMDKRGKRS